MKSEPGFQKRRVFGLICLAFLLSCSKPKPDEIVAQVDDISIKVGDIQKILRREGDIFENKSTRFSKPFLKAKERILNDLIDKKLLLREAMNKGTAVSDEEFEKELNKYKSNSTEVGFQKMLQETSMSYDEWVQLKRENFTVTKFMKEGNVVATNLTPDEVQKYYDEHVDQFKRPESVHVRQIVTDTKEKAESILRRLQNGENFAKLARDLSLSPDRKDGGDLGFITRGSFPREFEVCFSMNPGEISPIIPSIYGFHLFKVLEKSPPKTLDIMEVHDKIVTQIKQKTLRSTLQSLLKELRVKTKIQINEDILKRITL